MFCLLIGVCLAGILNWTISLSESEEKETSTDRKRARSQEIKAAIGGKAKTSEILWVLFEGEMPKG